ncbi:MAG: hypothetical protein Q7T33_14665 [Dehalococcoidia bacterium]|nr:hypothetical protein [Dehalococcoidia bacterium]
MNETNRLVIVLCAAAAIILMGVVIFLAWTADSETVDRLGDFVEYLDAHRTDTGRLIVTLAALAGAVLALLVIVLELAPEEEGRELRLEQAGATTIVPAEALRLRLQEALVALPEVVAARARVSARARGIASVLDLTVSPRANVAAVTQQATRVIVDTIQTDLGLPVAGAPTVRIAFARDAAPAPVASSAARAPEPPPAPASEPAAAGPPPQEAAAGTSPWPAVYDAPPPGDAPAPPPDERPGEDHPADQA